MRAASQENELALSLLNFLIPGGQPLLPFREAVVQLCLQGKCL